MTPVQARMARAALALTVEDLAGKAGVSVEAVRAQEAGQTGGDAAGAARLRATLEAAGVTWLDDDGVRLRPTGTGAAGTVPVEELNSANDE